MAKNDLSMSDRQEAVRTAIRARVGTNMYVVDMYDDRAVYQTYGEGTAAGLTYEIDYSIDEDGTVTLGDAATKVERRTTYTAVKFVEGSDSIIEGLAIPYGGSFKGRDLHGETFSAKTDLALDWFPDEGRPFLYHHGLDRAVKTTLVGRQISREERPMGQWVQVQLDKRSKYMDAISDLVDKGALGFSSGSMPHLVRTAKNGHIDRWPWVELSGTPTPAEPGAAVYAVKSADAIEHLVAVKAAAALVSILNTTDDEQDTGPVSFDAHAQRVAEDVADFVTRAKARIDTRAAKAGRELSAVNREKLSRLRDAFTALDEVRSEVEALLSRTDPAAQKAVDLVALEAELVVSELYRAGHLD